MCEYCNGSINPMSFPVKVEYDNGTTEIICYGLHINKEKGKMIVFIKPFQSNDKEELFSQTINYCPFCGDEL